MTKTVPTVSELNQGIDAYIAEIARLKNVLHDTSKNDPEYETLAAQLEITQAGKFQLYLLLQEHLRAELDLHFGEIAQALNG